MPATPTACFPSEGGGLEEGKQVDEGGRGGADAGCAQISASVGA